MTTDTTTSGYSHTQRAPLCWILYGCAFACVALAWMIGDTTGSLIAGGVALLIAFFASALQHLTVEDQGGVLAIRFGPIPLFRRTVRYGTITKVEVDRTTILDGWGIHYSMLGGWVWNIWGWDCVVLRFKYGGLLKVGTDDAVNLAEFLKRKISERAE